MKTTMEIPDRLFRKAKSAAAMQGQSLKDWITNALERHLTESAPARASETEIRDRWQRLASDLGTGKSRGPSYVDELLEMRRGRETDR